MKSWADEVDADVERNAVADIADQLREKMRPGALLRSGTLTNGMPVLVTNADAATCALVLEAVELDTPPEFEVTCDDTDGSFYISLNSNM
jgi:hypothetical protein